MKSRRNVQLCGAALAQSLVEVRDKGDRLARDLRRADAENRGPSDEEVERVEIVRQLAQVENGARLGVDGSGLPDLQTVKRAEHHVSRRRRFGSPGPLPVIQRLRTVLGEVPPATSVVERARAVHPIAAELVEPLLAPTFAPTMISASRKRNVIPALCEIVVDCRLLPGQTPAEIEPVVRRIRGTDVRYDLEFLKAEGGTRSPLDTPLWAAVESFVAELEPGAAPVPVICAGFTDSHWLREAFGTVAYGFFPYKTMTPELAASLIHSADERVPVSDLELGVDWLRHAARTVCA